MSYKFITLFRVALFQFIWGTVKYVPSPLGEVLRFLILKVFMKQIRTAWIRPGVSVWWPERISIGRSSVNEDVMLNGFGGIEIGDRVLIGHRCTLFSDEHKFEDPDQLIWEQGRCPARIRIEDDVYLGCNVVILAGVTIGRGAVIGAGSIVKKDIPRLAVAVGSPAKVVRYRGDRLEGRLGK